MKVNNITSMEQIKTHMEDIYQEFEPSKITINHDIEMHKSIKVFEGCLTPTNVSFKYQCPNSYDLNLYFPKCVFNFNFMSDRCL